MTTATKKRGKTVNRRRTLAPKRWRSIARYVLACAKCDAEGGMVQNSSTGTPMQSPWVAIRNKMWEQVYKAATAFGLTPADVSGVRSVEKPTAEDAKGKFFKRA